MGNNKNSQAKLQQECSQATATDNKVSKKEGCKDFRKFLNSILSFRQMQDLPLTLGESKHQVTMWIRDPHTIPFVVFEYIIEKWSKDMPLTQGIFPSNKKVLFKLMAKYELGFDKMTLRHYHVIQNHPIGHYYTLEELLRQWAGSSKLLKCYLEELRERMSCSKHQLSLWLKYPQSIPHKEAVILIHYLPNFIQYNQHRNGQPLGYEDKSLLEKDSLYAHFQIGFDTIPLRKVFEFLNHQKAID